MQTAHTSGRRGGRPEAHARRSDISTSHTAAQSLSHQQLTDTQQAVGAVLNKYGPLTDAGLIDKYRELEGSKGTRLPAATDSSLRTRRKELVDRLVVFDCGKTRSESGRPTTMWGTKRPGRKL